MPLPTIADCYRLAIKWSNTDGRTAINVIHVLAPTSTEDDVAQLWAESVNGNMWATVGGDAEIVELVVTKLDGTPDGNVYGQTTLVGWNATADAFTGNGSAQYVPQASALVKETTAASGRSGRGRVFLPWLGETENNNGAIAEPARGNVTAGWVDFANDLVAGGMALAIASYLHSTASQVLDLACEAYSGTQRRRNNTFR